ncbi:malto-oligosyltrehalose trehalohydrolase [Sphingomonas sp. CGMCC 1.13654]|uniref:Malto-oligosyltrehalose trehalohydrolase n=1 Tax=Sphingomonas chungangi TaxID=2683589 RepID=A0A838L4L2_9SPHN|nr:malto-oligosyltrehalose trehalohydrolase [Sphingomonas chungangi]MBA2934443.1 malto-oligosyltrehalose trehalohydrolase [Sphingomonas chungangi]MVW57482.1 malto-oligosyltrehalose trehalohydrolase [Sphingomonas chungangi]
MTEPAADHPARWGARIVSPDRARFAIWAPDRDEIRLEIEGRAPIAMDRAQGWFTVETDAVPGARYRFRLSDGLAVPDPASRAQAGDVHGWSLLVDPDAYVWQCPDWRGRPWHEAVIYEAHVGVAGGFLALADQLPALTELGVTAIEIMPVAAFPGTRNWGYDGVLPYAPASAYGSPDDLKALVDRAHQCGLMIFLDVVYNHFGPDGNYLPAYARDFFHPEVYTPWGAAIAFDRAEVADFFIGNARMWIEEYRFDGLRFDAAHAIGDTDFLDRMAREIRAGAGGRFVHLILENEANDADRLGEGRFDAQWNDDFHNVLHVLLTGEAESYYRDFADKPAERLVRCLGEGFIYQGEGSPNHDGKPRGTPSGHLAPTAFVSFLQNHDQVGNRAMGERLLQLVTPARLKAATALLLLSPQIPLLFMGEEDGSDSPFLFFTDFHDELADAVREGRRKEFAGHAAFSDPDRRAAIPDPNAPDTFHRSRPQPRPEREAWRAFYRDLLGLRRDEIVPRLPGAAPIGARAIGDKAVMARWTMGDGAELCLALNLGEEPVAIAAPSGTPFFALGEGPAGTLAPGSLQAWLG